MLLSNGEDTLMPAANFHTAPLSRREARAVKGFARIRQLASGPGRAVKAADFR